MNQMITHPDFDEDEFLDFVHFRGDEIAEELGLRRQADTSWSESDLAALYAECRKRYITDLRSAVAIP